MIAELAPVIRTVTVDVSPKRAFEVFTTRIGEWWPLARHAVYEDAETVVVEPRVGGRIYEVTSAGREGLWGEVTVFDPPTRFALSWHPNPDAVAPTEIEVTFEPEGDGTRVELTHTGWERLGDLAPAARAEYEKEWPYPLKCFADACG